jgi:outer membrane protein OmpA-like peptidoglycan-associated protein
MTVSFSGDEFRLACAVTAVAGSLVLGGCNTLDRDAADAEVRHRVYAGAGLLISRLEPDTSGVAGTSVDESMSAGGSITLGYDLNPRFSVEAHVAGLGEASLDPAGDIGYAVGGFSGVMYGLNGSSNRSRREGFAWYGRLGIGAMDNSASRVNFKRINDVHLLAGLGVEYGLAHGLGLRAELVAHETDARYVQTGLVYRFGAASSRHTTSVAVSARTQPPDRSVADEVPVAGIGEEALPAAVAGADAVSESASAPGLPGTGATAPGIADVDGDRVPDSADQCPHTVAQVPVGEDGCAIFTGVVEGISFKPGSSTLTDEASTVLEGIAQVLRDYPNIRVVVHAHTDNIGSALSNLQLSRRRAIAVARYLVEAGISGSRLKPQAFGETRPRARNSTPEGRAANRRVEFTVLQ